MENVSMIAAVGKNLELGYDNELIWRIPDDLKFFRDNTIGKSIVMGINTFRSLPGILPMRRHIVLTHQNIANNDIVVYHELDELLDYIKSVKEEIMIIGGAKVYQEFLEYANQLILTEINATSKADAYFPEFNKDEFESKIILEDTFENIEYKRLVYTRKVTK